MLVEEKPDYVAVYGWTSLLYFLAQWKKILRYQLVFICALDSEIDGKFRYTNRCRGKLFECGMRLCNARFGITEYQKHLFHTQGMSCSLMRLLLQDNLPKKNSPPEKSVDLLWVARCHSIKQPLLFLALAERFPKRHCQMICSMQEEKLWDKVKERAQQLPNVEFLEKVPYHDIQSYFDQAKIFVNTSLEEGVPNTFIHAGLGGAAIASLRVDPDGMFHRFHLGLCAGDQTEELVNGIQKLLTDSELLLFAQQESARFVQEWHNNQKNVKAFLDGLGSSHS